MRRREEEKRSREKGVRREGGEESGVREERGEMRM